MDRQPPYTCVIVHPAVNRNCVSVVGCPELRVVVWYCYRGVT